MISPKPPTPGDILNQPPLMSFNFLVVFYNGKGINAAPNPIDVRFQKVAGLGLSMGNLETKRIGGKNVRLPSFPTHENLTLERGYVLRSPLRAELETSFENLQMHPRDVMVMLLDPQGVPQASWIFFKAYPVKWNLGDLDANQSSIFIETMDLSYTRFQSISL
ncbi:hypothetical protein BKI52_09975 [marine bacterium AO1-C]|nr:hypothetical protein BKI52_09975 [marine bacterium AO1-C]